MGAAMLAVACTAGAAGPPDASTADLERQLADARRRLDEAARQMAELSSRLAGAEMQRIRIRAPHAVLGVTLGASTPDGGIAIASVAPGGPAAAAGLRAGDAITSVNGRAPKSQQDLMEQMQALPAESTVEVGYRRNGQVQHVQVHSRPDESNIGYMRPEYFAVWPGMALEGLDRLGRELQHGGLWNDLELATLSPKLGGYFGTDHGVLVVQAPAASSLKLEDGDVITAIDGREPKDGPHALRILGSYRPGESLHLRLIRDHRAIDVEAVAPPGASGFGPLSPLSPLPPRPPLAPTPPAPPAAPSSAGLT
jgi:S1-C subfamily serine protease